VLNYTAYFSEIFRGGIQSINRGQYEAASVLGLSKGLTMRKIVIPQVFKIVLPSLGNEVINLVKDTALVSIIALGDLLKIAYSASMREANIMPLVAVLSRHQCRRIPCAEKDRKAYELLQDLR